MTTQTLWFLSRGRAFRVTVTSAFAGARIQQQKTPSLAPVPPVCVSLLNTTDETQSICCFSLSLLLVEEKKTLPPIRASCGRCGQPGRELSLRSSSNRKSVWKKRQQREFGKIRRQCSQCIPWSSRRTGKWSFKKDESRANADNNTVANDTDCSLPVVASRAIQYEWNH